MSMSTKRCPREGLEVRFDPNPASFAMYSARHRALLPTPGDTGKVVTVPLPGGRRTCMRGPGGGLIYVRWRDGITVGVSAYDVAPAGSQLSGARRRRRRGRR